MRLLRRPPRSPDFRRAALAEEPMPKYERILLKLSGEVLAGNGKIGLDACDPVGIIERDK